MIELQNVKKVFNAGNQVTVLKGPSGSGKTTLLSIVGCMSRPSAGRVRLNGREITSLPERFLTDIRRKSFGLIFQKPNLIKGISVLDNVMLPAYSLGEKRSLLKAKTMQGLAELNIANKADSKVEWLSGGEAQRASIVRALINDPHIIIADEPTAHLDSKLSYRFMEIIEKFKADGKTVIANLLAAYIASGMVLYAVYYGVQILKSWDIQSGHELQLVLERRTYLISTVLSYVFGLQLLSLFLFIFTADNLTPLFVGAMCAAGTLNVGHFGYATMVLKICNFILAGLWLVLNHADNLGAADVFYACVAVDAGLRA